MKKILSILLILAMLVCLASCGLFLPFGEQSFPTGSTDPTLDPYEFYYSKEDVALYIHTFDKLPTNYVTKSAANSRFGSYNKAMQEGYRIGGDRFYNREGLLPAKAGRTYTECDIAAEGKASRGAYRIVFSNDGLIYYTHDHYNTFELLYGEP